MSAKTLIALQEMTCSARLGGGSVLQLPEVSELLGHVEAGNCSEALLLHMAEVPRAPTPDEWAAMRAGESPNVPEPPPEPEPEPEPDPDPEPDEEPEPLAAEAETEEPSAETEEPATEEEPGADDNVAPV